MTRALEARGPDGEGYHLDGPIGLGHRRLAIIDVEGGRQPLYSEDGRVATIVNGEIYNFPALREELVRAGHRFATRSDSETIVHGYEEWGEGVLDRIEGMFALVIWDGRERSMLLARDRMGEKPLFWAELPGGGVAFASELKALKHAPGVPRDVDPDSLAQYLAYEYVPAPRSMIRGVRKLEPGTALRASPGRAPATFVYWDLAFPEGERLRDAEAAAAALREELRASVRARLVSDVPLGVFLSGGIDSSTVAALAAEARGGDIDTFSVAFEDPRFDESPAARMVARHIGSRHHEERLSPATALELMPAIGKILDEPIGDASIVPTHLLARFARRHVTVALGGDGGDELFAGYQTFQAERVAQIIDVVPRALRVAAFSAGETLAAALPTTFGYMPLDFKIRRFLRGARETGARRHQAWIGALGGEEISAVLGRDANGWDGVLDRRLAGCRSADRWDRLMYFYAKGFLADQVLQKVDRATMAVGLEGRAPMLATRVVGLATRLDPSLRLRGLTTKYLLKRAMKGLLPDTILGRRKQGFAMPIGPWLRGELRGLLEDTLAERSLREGGLFDAAVVRRWVKEHVDGTADHRKALWTLLAFERWRAEWKS
ncbi:MAG TPA: asparagine synthase (glutamine-hydrolyzing) [Haliangiales bacterium]|nr:asparagine synthase (glutamine-hydrolyzing) [Haliangiales bacterium]